MDGGHSCVTLALEGTAFDVAFDSEPRATLAVVARTRDAPVRLAPLGRVGERVERALTERRQRRRRLASRRVGAAAAVVAAVGRRRREQRASERLPRARLRRGARVVASGGLGRAARLAHQLGSVTIAPAPSASRAALESNDRARAERLPRASCECEVTPSRRRASSSSASRLGSPSSPIVFSRKSPR